MTSGYRLHEQHEPTWSCDDYHCYTHHVDELRIGQPHRVCGECFHVFPTRLALLYAYCRGGWPIYWSEVKHPMKPPRSLLAASGFGPVRVPRLRALWTMLRVVFIKTKHITFCPHCAHDF